MTIGAGKLRHRIKFYRATTTRSVTGAVSHEWEHILTLWGQFAPLSVKDVVTGQSAGVDVTARLTVRHRTDIDHTMCVQYAGRMYEIVGEPLADNGSGKEYLALALRVVSNDR